MRPRDTAPDVQRVMDDYYRGMTPVEKGAAFGGAWDTARTLQMVGLRSRFPDESEADLELRMAEAWLGTELYERVRAWQAARASE